MPPSWPLSQVNQLKALLADKRKLSAAKIAVIMGISRNAVIGKAHRLGLRFSNPSCVDYYVARIENWKRDARKNTVVIKNQIPVKTKPGEVVMKVQQGNPISWITAPQGICVNAIGDPSDIMICGNTRHGDRNYCMACLPKMYKGGCDNENA